MKRDLYSEVSTRIIAELERGAAPWIKPWSATLGQNVCRHSVVSGAYCELGHRSRYLLSVEP
jgi:antirestriction protein ArdC